MRTLFVCFAGTLLLSSAQASALAPAEARRLPGPEAVRMETREAPLHLALATGSAKRKAGSDGNAQHPPQRSRGG